MKRAALIAALAVTANGPAVYAQQPAQNPPARSIKERAAAAPIPDRTSDEKAIKALLDAFTKAFNSGDAAAVAATYTETAVVVDDEGERIEGRAAIQAQYAESFASSPGSTIVLKVEALRFLGAETALEEGRATVTPAKGEGAPEQTRFTAIYVKSDGKWLQAAVRDEPAKEVAASDRLKELDWLVGEWVNESQDAIVSTTCKWADGGHFLVREFTVQMRGKPVLSGTQRIGWDPVRKQFKTWVFDTEGGHAEGYWSRNGDQWTIKLDGVRQDGLHASATNIVTRQGKDKMHWQSVDRTLGGASIPGADEFTIVRKPPAAGK